MTPIPAASNPTAASAGPALTEEQVEAMIDALAGVIRILEAVRYTAGLSGTQLKRLEAAKAVLAAARSTEGART